MNGLESILSALTFQGFVPTWVQAAGLVAALASGLVMLVLGRVVLGARILPEVALIAGWGAISLVITLWGVVTPLDMRIPAVALIGVAMIGVVTPRGRLERGEVIALGRVIALSLPLLLVFIAAYPSQPDTFTNQLPNAAYLHDYGQFPAANRPPMLAVWPAFPYNLQIAAFIPALLTPDFPPSILTHVNIVLDLAFALLLARWMRPAGTPLGAVPSWPAIAAALLFTTFLAPGFDPKILFSGYGDPAIAVAVAFAGWQTVRLLDVMADGQPEANDRLTLTLVLLAGAAIKQVSIVLMASIVGTAFLVAAFDRRIGPKRALMALLPAIVPALLLRGVWEFYATTQFAPEAELRLMPLSDWNIGSIPTILVSAAEQIWERMPFFIVLYGILLGAIPLTIKRGLVPVSRLFLITAGTTLLYTGFLIFTYVAHFRGAIGASAHSFFRYNMHVGLLAILAVIGLARQIWADRGTPQMGSTFRGFQVAGLVLILVTPVLLAGWLRYDRRAPQPLIWDLARFAAPYFQDDDKIALLLPGDNGGAAPTLRVAISLTQPRHMLANFQNISSADPAALDEAAKGENKFALVSCVTPELAAIAGEDGKRPEAGRAALLKNDKGHWTLLATHAYPTDLPPTKKWSAQFSAAPFCH